MEQWQKEMEVEHIWGMILDHEKTLVACTVQEIEDSRGKLIQAIKNLVNKCV